VRQLQESVIGCGNQILPLSYITQNSTSLHRAGENIQTTVIIKLNLTPLAVNKICEGKNGDDFHEQPSETINHFHVLNPKRISPRFNSRTNSVFFQQKLLIT